MQYDATVLERVAQRFRRDMWTSVVPEAVTESGIQVERFGPVQATAFADLPDVRGVNQVQGAAEPGAVSEGHLGRAVDWMRAREVDYRVPVAEGRPGSEEAEMWLVGHGYEPSCGWVKLVRDVSPPDIFEDPAIVIYELGQEEGEGEGLSTIVPEALELPVTVGTLLYSLPEKPGWRCYTASFCDEEGIVAAASMLIDDGVAQLGPGMTLEDARGRGCNMALLRRRLIDAAAAGCHTVFVELGEAEPDQIFAASRNLLRAGFEQVYASSNWKRPALSSAELY
jgi:hypothetical protein